MLILQDPSQAERKFPPVIDYSLLHPRSTRSSASLFVAVPGQPCSCFLCDLGRMCLDYPQWHAAHSNPAGRPAKEPAAKSPPTITVCSKCFTPYGPGKPHTCNRSNRQENLSSMVRENSDPTQSRVAANTLKSLAAAGDTSTSGGTLNLLSGGPNYLPVKIGKARDDDRGKKRVSHEDLMAIQRTLNCSDTKLLKLNQCLGVILGQKKLEPYLQDALIDRNHKLEDVFSLQKAVFTHKTKAGEEEVNRPVIVANIPALITLLIESRNLDPDNHLIQLGLDGGQSVLKFCLIVQDDVTGLQEPPRQRARHKDGIGSGDSKLSSVKKLLIIGAAPNTEESWGNLRKMMDMLEIDLLGSSYGLSVDMKVQLMLCGKQSASCRHCCPYCECCAPFTCDCTLNTLGSLSTHYNNFLAAGANEKDAKLFNNCTKPALLSGSSQLTILDILTFPELHVMTGTVGKIVTELIKAFPVKEDGEEFMNTFMNNNNISWCDYQPGTFEGNQARKLLRLSHRLELEARKLPKNTAIRIVLFTRTISLFNQVVSSCFGQQLDPGFKVAINKFSSYYRRLGISVTPKVHCVMVHAVQFLERKGLVAGLGAWSEQAMEAAHHDFKLEWERTKVGPHHPKYDEAIFNAVLRYNSKHI